MKIFKTFSVILLVFIMQECFSQGCSDRMVQIFPITNTITSNSAFLINFSEDDYKIKDKIETLVFTASSSTGKKYKLSIIESNFSGTLGQFFLKSKSKLSFGDTISINISLKNKDTLSGKIKLLNNSINWKKWVVKFKTDKKRPILLREPTYQVFDYKNGLTRGYSVEFLNLEMQDNSFTDPDYNIGDYELFLKAYFCVEFMNQRFICSGDHETPRIFNGTCRGNFNFEYNKSYSAKIRAVDTSGNFSKNEKILYFKTTTSN